VVDIAWVESILVGAVQAGTVYLLASLGETYAERSGVLNLGLEGMMIMGAAISFIFTNALGHAAALLATTIMGLAMGLLLAFLTVSLRLNQIVVGLALTLFGLGLSGFITSAKVRKGILLALNPGISEQALVIQQAPNLPIIRIPVLSEVPFLGRILFSQNILVYLALVLAAIMWVVLFRTSFGLSLRSVGENPAMADAMGVNVYLMRYIAVMIGGVLAALSGAYLFIGYQPFWVEGMTQGRGFISLALVILATWSPLRAILGAFLFGGVEVLQFRLQLLGIGAQTPQLVLMLPYAVTIITLTLLSFESVRKRIGVPAALTIPYSRE